MALTSECKSRGPELLVDLVERTTAVVIEMLDLDPELAEAVGEAVASEMRAAWGGQQVYFPKGITIEISERDRAIYEEFHPGQGRDQNYLARQYGVSVQWIYTILKKVRSADIASRQKDLFRSQ